MIGRDFYTLAEAFNALGRLIHLDRWVGSEVQWSTNLPDGYEGLLDDWEDYLVENPDYIEALSAAELEQCKKECNPSYVRYLAARDALFEMLHSGSILVAWIAPNGQEAGDLPRRLWLDQTGEFTVDIWNSVVYRNVGAKEEEWRVRIPKSDFDATIKSLKETLPVKDAGRPERYQWGWLETRLKEMFDSGAITLKHKKATVFNELASEHDAFVNDGQKSDPKYIGKKLRERYDDGIKRIKQ